MSLQDKTDAELQAMFAEARQKAHDAPRATHGGGAWERTGREFVEIGREVDRRAGVRPLLSNTLPPPSPSQVAVGDKWPGGYDEHGDYRLHPVGDGERAELVEKLRVTSAYELKYQRFALCESLDKSVTAHERDGQTIARLRRLIYQYANVDVVPPEDEDEVNAILADEATKEATLVSIPQVEAETTERIVAWLRDRAHTLGRTNAPAERALSRAADLIAGGDHIKATQQ